MEIFVLFDEVRGIGNIFRSNSHSFINADLLWRKRSDRSPKPKSHRVYRIPPHPKPNLHRSQPSNLNDRPKQYYLHNRHNRRCFSAKIEVNTTPFVYWVKLEH
jgi:hypothetical protein